MAAALAMARAEGAREVVATAGSEGTWVLTADGAVLVEPFPIEVVSTLGAGDVFHGAILAGLVRGDSLLDATRRANAAAALACREMGGRSGIPGLAELDAFARRPARR